MSAATEAPVEAPSSHRPWTPDETLPSGSRRIHVRRACNGCGALIGDITEAELDAAVEGGALPDVRGECPVCTPWSGTTELEPAWAPVLHFNHRFHKVLPFPEVRYRVPANTCDPRWDACRVHHPACDCREAEQAENLNELRHDAQHRTLLVDRLRAVARLHAPVTDHRPMCPVCIEAAPCSTRTLAVEGLKAVRAWYPEDEE